MTTNTDSWKEPEGLVEKLSTGRAIRCPNCRCKMKPLPWIPSVGYDPLMKKYKCGRCKRELYKIPPIIYLTASTLPFSLFNSRNITIILVN